MGNIFDTIPTGEEKPGGPKKGNTFDRLDDERKPPPASEISAAIAAAGDAGNDIVRNNRGQAIDAEGNPIPEPREPSGPVSGAQGRGIIPRTEDFLTRLASSAQFGFGEKLSATGPGRWMARAGKTDIRDLIQGKVEPGTDVGLTYDEVLAKRRRNVEEAGERLGTAGTVAADLSGGLLTGSLLARGGLTVAGRVPAGATLGTKVGAGALEGAGYGAAYGAGHTDTGEIADYIKNMATSGGVGLLTGGAFPAAARGVQRAITPLVPTAQRQAAVDTLREAGVTNITAGQATQSPRLRYLEDIAAKMVGGRNPAGEFPQGTHQMQQATAAAMERAGIPRAAGQQATPEVLQEAATRIGGGINTINQAHPITIDRRATMDVVDIINDVLPRLEDGQRGPVRHFLRRFIGGQGNTLDPDVAQAMRTQINQHIGGSTGAQKEAYIAVKDALDSALERTIMNRGNTGRVDDYIAARAQVQQLNELRQQYANLSVVIDGISRSGAAGAEGTLTPSALSGALSSSVGKSGAVLGQGDLNPLARSISSVLRNPPESGTATRNSIRELASIVGSIGIMRPFIGSRPAQAYWGNQALPGPGVSGQAGAAAAAGAATPSLMGPADRIMNGLLMP